MTKPDWSKAPEGATHFGEATGDWYKIGKGFYLWVETKCWTPLLALPSENLIEMRPQWRGPEDGLPPVGTVCEIAASTPYLKIDHPEGAQVKVYAHFTDDRGVKLAAYVDSIGSIGGVAIAKVFRPIKTQEQRELEQLQADIDEAFEDNAVVSSCNIAGLLHAKGYRRP